MPRGRKTGTTKGKATIPEEKLETPRRFTRGSLRGTASAKGFTFPSDDVLKLTPASRRKSARTPQRFNVDTNAYESCSDAEDHKIQREQYYHRVEDDEDENEDETGDIDEEEEENEEGEDDEGEDLRNEVDEEDDMEDEDDSDEDYDRSYESVRRSNRLRKKSPDAEAQEEPYENVKGDDGNEDEAEYEEENGMIIQKEDGPYSPKRSESPQLTLRLASPFQIGHYTLRKRKRTNMRLQNNGGRRRKSGRRSGTGSAQQDRNIKKSLHEDSRFADYIKKNSTLKTTSKYFRSSDSESSEEDVDKDEKAFQQRVKDSMGRARAQIQPLNDRKNPQQAEIDALKCDFLPLELDPSITWKSVGGLDAHIKQLKEMVIFPLMYPEVFENFKVKPPKGVLFYGPPGTGKTLVARALANSCSQANGKKISFFMRKGADVLSKWVGETERQLRLLFDQAKRLQPSVIFFDEIDGLAPVRSSKQDQIHSSIVSTLLGLMDGVDDRGQIVIIGATNRIDSVDPALRRPGRFDREFPFPLPTKEGRSAILEVHCATWSPPLDPLLMESLVERTAGFCGADLKALCSEAVVNALQRRYPQIYESDEKLLLNPSAVKIEERDFNKALQRIIPTAHRSATLYAKALDAPTNALVGNQLSELILMAKRHFNLKSEHNMIVAGEVYRPGILIRGERDMGQLLLSSALLNSLELQVFALTPSSLFGDTNAKNIQEACARIFSEAVKNVPSIVYIPHFEWWSSEEMEETRHLLQSMLREVSPTLPLYTIAVSLNDDILDAEITNTLGIMIQTFTMRSPTKIEIKNMVDSLYVKCLEPPPKHQTRVLEKLPIVPLPKDESGQLEETEQMHAFSIEQIEKSHRQLRIVLREIATRLIQDRRFSTWFTNLPETTKHPQYYEMTDDPITLYTILDRIDHRDYITLEAFVKDCNKLIQNVEQYYGQFEEDGCKRLISRARALQDTMYLYTSRIKKDLIEKCKMIAIYLEKHPIKQPERPGQNSEIMRSSARLKGVSLDYSIMHSPPRTRKQASANKTTDDEAIEDLEKTEISCGDPLEEDIKGENSAQIPGSETISNQLGETISIEQVKEPEPQQPIEEPEEDEVEQPIVVDQNKLKQILKNIVDKACDQCCVESLLHLRNRLLLVIEKYSYEYDRSAMLKEMKQVQMDFKR